MKRLGVLLITAALIAGLVGCPAGPQHSLTISSTAGGSVTTPGEGTFTYAQGTAASLVAAPDAGFRFVEWTGDVGTIADVTSRITTIAMNGDYSITANFVAVRNLTITSSAGGSVTAPGEGTFVYDLGTVVNLAAVPDRGYRFVAWTGDTGTIAGVGAPTTTISMSGDCSIAASFELAATGAFLDEVVITKESDAATAIQYLKDDALDVYAHGLGDPALYAEVLADPDLAAVSCLGNYFEFTFNPVGPTFPETGRLNPFSVPKFREAMHWLVERDYIAQEIMGGMAIPRYTCLQPGGTDATERFADIIAELETKYAPNPAKAETIVAEEMQKLGAVLEEGKWVYDGEPVTLIFLIRTEDKRKEMGEYFASLLEDIGFTVTRQYGRNQELSELWFRGDPALGRWHIYTGGWVGYVVTRDEGWTFGYFYTRLGAPPLGPLWQAYVNDQFFYEAAEKLWNNDYAAMEERAALFQVCLPKSMEDNAHMWLVTHKPFSPMRANVRVPYDLASSQWGSWMWALTAHFLDGKGEPMVGGTLRVAMPDLLSDAWNPVSGPSWGLDRFAIRATGDQGLQTDIRDGLRWPGRIERAQVFAQTGTAVGVTNTDWCSLTFVPEIQIPLDAWADWDAASQKFITIQDRFGAEGTTAKTKSVSYYRKDVFDVRLHDGSTLSVGDFILYTILQFDRAKPQSAIYDESAVGAYSNLMNQFRGVRFITDNPDYGLIVEYYSDLWQLDAELMVNTMFPFYSQGSGVWHTIALGIRAEEDGALAFSQAKSNALVVEWMSFISGPSLPFLTSYLTSAKAANYIPYEPTMGQYVTEAEAAERWANLENWYSEKGHFWVASGPFYLESADTTEKIIHLKRFEDYPDPMDRWLFLLEPLP